MKTSIRLLGLGLLLGLLLPAVGQAQFTFTTNSGAITITGYTGPGGAVAIPDTTNGLPVISIGAGAFRWCYNLTSVTMGDSVTSIGSGAFADCWELKRVAIGSSVTNIGSGAFVNCWGLQDITIPNSVTSIGDWAFRDCTSLRGVYFQGNAPGTNSDIFYPNNGVVYYLPGTTGWRYNFAGLQTMLWNPQVQTSGANFGVRTNQFGFGITGASDLVVVVEACTNLIHPVWLPVKTNTPSIISDTTSYFSDSQWTNHSARFYRLRSP